MGIVPSRLPKSKHQYSKGVNTLVLDWIRPFLALLLYCIQGEVPGCILSNKKQISVPKRCSQSGTKAQWFPLQCPDCGDSSYNLQRLYANSLVPISRTGLKGDEATTCPPSGMRGQPCRAVRLQQPEISPHQTSCRRSQWYESLQPLSSAVFCLFSPP